VRTRLIIGTINAWPDDTEWRNFTLDVQPRGIWHPELNMIVQPDFVADMTMLADFRDEMFDEIRAHHVLEHVTRDDGVKALEQISRIVKRGGILDVEVPDLDRVTAAYTAGEIDADSARQWLLGEQLANHRDPDTHRMLWTEDELRVALEHSGYRVGAREDTELALRFRAARP
jgi:predicted SAM-dependent methyltransferase